MSTSGSYVVEGIRNAPMRPRGVLGCRHLQALLMFLGLTLAYMIQVNTSFAIWELVNAAIKEGDFTFKRKNLEFIENSFLWGYTVTQIPSGLIAQRWGAQKLFGILMFLCGVTNLVVPIAARYGGRQAVAACRLVMGLTQGCVLPCVHTLLAKWAPPEERGRLGTFVYAGVPLASVIALALYRCLATFAWGLDCIICVSGILTMSWSVIWFFFGKDSPAKHPHISIEEKQYIEQSLNTLDPAEKLSVPWRHIATSVPMWALLIVHCGQIWGYSALVKSLFTNTNDVLHHKNEMSILVFVLPYLAMWILSFPFSWCTDFVLKKGVSRGASRKISNTIGHWGPAVALIVLGFITIDNFTVFSVICVIAVGLNAGSLCGYQLNHLDLSPNYAGTMMSITNCIACFMSILVDQIYHCIYKNFLASDDYTEMTLDDIVDELRSTANLWRSILCFVGAGIFLAGNLVFIVFGSGEVQWWNDPRSPQFNRGNVRDENIPLNQNPSSPPESSGVVLNSVEMARPYDSGGVLPRSYPRTS